MDEKLNVIKEKVSYFWTNRTKTQKSILIGSILVVLLLIVAIPFFMSSTKYVPLYNNLSLQEVGQIKEELDARGISYEIEEGGTTISVPDDQVDSLLVELAGQGLPNSGSIDYSFFSENASWGVTDNEFDIMKLDAMQTELSNLIKSVDGIQDANVMINMPKDPIFVNEEDQSATASIVIHTKPGYQFEGNQINSLYHLVSKAVPNLPPENIAIMDQYFEYYDQKDQSHTTSGNSYASQQSIKKDVEKDIQRRAQQMLGTMIGMENVIVSVTTDIDFTQENRVEEIVEPVDEDNMEGLPVSIETIHETYTGNPEVGGVAGTGEEDVAGYEAVETDDGEYELVKETINNEFNNIRKEIVESPYKIRDMGIQVAVNNVSNRDGDNIQYLSQNDQNVVEQGIESILNSIITTSIDEEYEDIAPEENVSIVFQEFSEPVTSPEKAGTSVPLWMYIIGGVLLLIIIILAVLLLRKRNENQEEYEEDIVETTTAEIPEINEENESEAIVQKKQLEKMAKNKPDEFAKLLRSWIGED
ncbi:MAG TPA: flagellar basal-body MS-ring/collar protein FliF [Bacillota bacterium]|nr:flagellar basal-body MS-ring/collar protein FliF [Bacillota bacterium]